MQLSQRLAALIIRTDDAYMVRSYGSERWREALQELIEAGWSDDQIDVWMKSKAARWANDSNKTPLAYFLWQIRDYPGWVYKEFQAASICPPAMAADDAR